MENWIYNGVELPPIATVWNETTYPYAVISKPSTTNGVYVLRVTTTPPYWSTNEHVEYMGEGTYDAYVLDDAEWKHFSGPYTYNAGASFSYIHEILWTNSDIFVFPDNTDIALSASDPVVLATKPFIYNGQELPALPERNESAYPYAMIWKKTKTQAFNLYFTAKPVTADTLTESMDIEGDYQLYECGYNPKETSWRYKKTVTNGMISWEYGAKNQILWANHGIYSGVMSEPIDINATHRLYNGVRLPDVHAVWVDKTTFPYAFIYRPLEGTYHLTIISAQPYRVNDVYINSSIYVHPSKRSEYVHEGGVWVEKHSNTRTDSNTRVGYGVLWTSFDILSADGSVYFSESEPVLLNDPTPNTTMCDYNGVMLPVLPVWDKEKYPYAYMYQNGTLDVYTNQYTVVATDYPLTGNFTSAMNMYASLKRITYTLNQDKENAWIFAGETTGSFLANTHEAKPIWSDYDLINPDDSIFFAESGKPVPVVPFDKVAFIKGLMCGLRLKGSYGKAFVNPK